jgi:hypothetical protein
LPWYHLLSAIFRFLIGEQILKAEAREKCIPDFESVSDAKGIGPGNLIVYRLGTATDQMLDVSSTHAVALHLAF